MLWTLGITTIVTPYVWSWDFVLLLPIWMYAFIQADWKRKALLLAFYAAAWFGTALIQSRTGSNNQEFWWVPIWFIGTLTLMTGWKGHVTQGTNS